MNNEYYNLYNNCNIQSLNRSLNNACKNGDLDKVKYLLDSPQLTLKSEIQNNNYEGLVSASWEGNIEVVKYLLTNYDSKDKKLSNLALSKAASGNKHELMNFLLTSNEIPYKADLNQQSNAIFLEALHNHRLKLIKYLIFDLDITLTPVIEHLLKNNNIPIIPEIKNWFKVRELNKEVNHELESTSNNERIKKIKL